MPSQSRWILLHIQNRLREITLLMQTKTEDTPAGRQDRQVWFFRTLPRKNLTNRHFCDIIIRIFNEPVRGNGKKVVELCSAAVE